MSGGKIGSFWRLKKPSEASKAQQSLAVPAKPMLKASASEGVARFPDIWEAPALAA